MGAFFNGMDERFELDDDDIVKTFNNTLSKLLARMTPDQREKAIENKSDDVLNNIFSSALNLEHYEVCQAIKTLQDKRRTFQ